MFKAYFDESGCDDFSKVLVVGGYLIDGKKSRVMRKKWVKTLDLYHIPYFHMVECAHGNGVFSKMSKQERIGAATDFIGLCKRFGECGIAVAIPPHRFEGREGGDPYVHCVEMCVTLVSSYLEYFKKQGGADIFFEAGHANFANASRSIARLEAQIVEPPRQKRILSHTFARKTEVCLLQAADLLCWQLRKYISDKVTQQRPPRKDFLNLVSKENRHWFMVHAVKDNNVLMISDREPHIESDERDLRLRDLFADNPLLEDAAIKAFYEEVKKRAVD